MARIGNEAKLILKLVDEKWNRLRDSRVQTPDRSYISGYDRAKSDHEVILAEVIKELEEK